MAGSPAVSAAPTPDVPPPPAATTPPASIDDGHGSRALVAAKLRPPDPRPGLVDRSASLNIPTDASVVAVVAPAGYGKSSSVAQWAHASGRRLVWLALDADDDDPAVFLQNLGAAVRQEGGIETPAVHVNLTPGSSVATVVARRFGASLAAIGDGVSVVLDNVETLRNPQCRDAVAELALHLPSNAQLIVISRSAPALPLPALRARGALVEVGVQQLAMDREEATALLAGAGVTLDPAELDDLLAGTEGWPVGLYLAALAHRAGHPASRGAFAFGGDDRLMADYLRTELLARIPRGRRQFLVRTSLLDGLSGPLCDAVLETRGSGDLLEALESSNLLIAPLDRRRAWYRYHPLFRQMLQTELRQREPDLVPVLLGRAARWCDQHEQPEAAIAYAQAADDPDLVASLVEANVIRTYAGGRLATVAGWLDWFDDREILERYPAVAVLGAAFSALIGQPAAAERRAAVAARADVPRTVADGSPFESWQAVVQALLCRRGVDQMRRDAHAAYEGMAPSSRWRAMAITVEGIGWLLAGDAERAEATLTVAVDVGLDFGGLPAVSVALAVRSLVAIERGDRARASDDADRALTLVADNGLDDYVTTALVYAIGAHTAVLDGDMARTRACLAQAARLRPQLTYAVPYLAVLVQVELARTYLALADAAGARAVLRDAADVLRLRPDLGVLADHVAELRERLESFEVDAVGASALTTAELRLVPLLSTHLSFPEIGQRLHISRHTVKTQAVSLYRKLGVSSRSEAIACLDQLGLLGS